jgi:hypothetical protein
MHPVLVQPERRVAGVGPRQPVALEDVRPSLHRGDLTVGPAGVRPPHAGRPRRPVAGGPERDGGAGVGKKAWSWERPEGNAGRRGNDQVSPHQPRHESQITGRTQHSRPESRLHVRNAVPARKQFRRQRRGASRTERDAVRTTGRRTLPEVRSAGTARDLTTDRTIPDMAEEDGRLRVKFHQLGAETVRLSSRCASARCRSQFLGSDFSAADTWFPKLAPGGL